MKARIRDVFDSIGHIAPLRLLTLCREDRGPLLRALPVVLLVRLSLWLVPVSRLQRMLSAGRPGVGSLTPCEARKLAWAVSAVADRIPSATCLTRALALQKLLRQRGGLSKVHVGFVSTGPGDVRGHAWLEWRGEVLIGGGEISTFRTTVTLHA